MARRSLNEERLKRIIRQISGKVPKSEDELIKPSYINCKGSNKEEHIYVGINPKNQPNKEGFQEGKHSIPIMNKEV